MKKKIIKILLVVLLLVTVGLLIENNTFAEWDINEQMNRFNEEANEAANGNTAKTTTKFVGSIINLVSIIGVGVAIIMLVVIGIQYVTKSAEGKAEAKKDLTGYVIGAILIFGVSGILKILEMFISGSLNNI